MAEGNKVFYLLFFFPGKGVSVKEKHEGVEGDAQNRTVGECP